ncbi:EAL domain-containing response regulator [Kistimonas asteriae]|uniref:EAL domain-containing response regulator n=1 Tax=Kistimonas asteriae TaxID=517724 RepID=UPI001BA5568F|nr:EAL domain-containing protein [Kistimonas asteriae]
MADNNQTIRLLLLEQSQNDAEQQVNLFRNAGHAIRMHRITSPEDLDDSLTSQTWDLLIAAEETDTLNARQVLDRIRHLKRDIPSIIRVGNSEPETVEAWLQAGAMDAIPAGRDVHLLLASLREVAHLNDRRRRQQAESVLSETEKRCELLLESSKDAIAYVHDGMHIYANPAYLTLFACDDPDEMICIPAIDLIHGEDQAAFRQFLKDFHQGNDVGELTFQGMRSDDNTFKARMTLSAASYEGEPCTQIVIRMDRVDPELEARLQELSHKDLTTGLFNRQYFAEQLAGAVELAVQGKSNSTLLDIRLDTFNDVKRSRGIADADLLLADVAKVMQGYIREPQLLARYGDDIFLALIYGDDEDTLDNLTTTLLAAVERHLSEVSGQTLQSTLSIGLMPVNGQQQDIEYLLTQAEYACIKARKAGGNQTALHDPKEELERKAREGNIVAMAQNAMENNGFTLLYQPTVNLEHPEEQYEVYVRLNNNDEEDSITTAEFLEACQKAGLARKVDRWVILQAIKQLAEKRKTHPETRLFVNISGESVRDQTLPSWLNIALKAVNLTANSLTIQISESELVKYLKKAEPVFSALKENGFELCISHFGLADKPLATLSHIAVDRVKIDASYIADITTDEKSKNQLQDLVNTLSDNDITVVMPRVESASELSCLWQMSVGYVQGYYIQAPEPDMHYDFEQ